VTVLAPGDAWELLTAAFRGSDVRVIKMPGLRFQYDSRHRVNRAATLAHGLQFLAASPRRVERVVRWLEEEEPDLVVTDFEPLLPRAAAKAKVPLIGVDHQHFLVVNDLSALPGRLRRRAAAMGLIVRMYCPRAAHRVVSSFYAPPVKAGWSDVTQVGVLLRRSILEAVPEAGDYLVAYLRRAVPHNVLEALRSCGREVRVYGLGERPREGRVLFRPISEAGFVTDLAGCAGLVSTAGNQLLGEAQHLGKPVLAFPEAKNFEQEINALFLERSGAGLWRPVQQLTAADVGELLERLPELRAAIDRDGAAGNAAVEGALERFLPAPTAVVQTVRDRRRHLRPALSPTGA
jgi:uncharacterized protein (TIGR00661 family)